MKCLFTAAVAATIVLLSTTVARADTLKTRSFKVEIKRNCPEGNVSCNNVSYKGTDLRTGKSLRLTGKTMNALCADGVTPCRFLGYQFQNGNYRYIVSEAGTLQVYQGKKPLLQETGTWTN